MRPFGNREGLVDGARSVWFALTPSDWLEAFAHHPKIGDRESLRKRFPTSGHLSEKEQAGMDAASTDVLKRFEAITDPAEQSRFYAIHRDEIMAAQTRQNKQS